jgi:hypothetical protein
MLLLLKLLLSYCNNPHCYYIYTDEPKGSDLLLEAVLEAEVAENAKFFISQPPGELPKE